MQKCRSVVGFLLLPLLLLFVFAAGGKPPGALSYTASGGTGGGPIAGALHVRVINSGSDDGTGNPLPVSGAFVMVGPKAGVPFSGNSGTANGNGEITFTSAALAGPQTVTAGANGYQFYSFVDVDASDIVIPLQLKDPAVPTARVSGTLTDFPGVNCDNWLQTSLLFPPLSLEDLVGFDLGGQMSEKVPVQVLGQTMWLPSNLVIPTQKENPALPAMCFLLGANISKPDYFLNLSTGTTQNIFSFGLKMDLSAMSGGHLDFSQIVPLEIGIARNVNVNGDTTVNIAMGSALTKNLTLNTANSPANYDVMLVSLGEINGALGQAPGVGDLVLLDFTQVPGGVPAAAQVRTTSATAPFSDIRYLAMAVAKPASGSGLTGSTGVLDRGGFTPPATRNLATFFAPVQLNPVSGDLFGFSNASQPGISPRTDMNLASLSLVTTVPDTRPGATPGATMDVTERLWTLALPGAEHSFRLPILPAGAPSVLPFPEQTTPTDKLAWGQTVVGLSLNPGFDFDNYDMGSFGNSFTHFSANTRDFSVDSDGDGIHLFEDNCPSVGNADQADLDGDGIGDACDPDQDGDEYRADQGDCNDRDPAVHPGATEICDDGIDNNCNVLVDGADPACLACTDRDGDGYYAEGGECGPLDCNDSNPNVHPGAADFCDGVDNDCNPTTPDGAGEAWNGAACDGPDGDLCAEGVTSCVAGHQSCSDNTGDNIELCDGVDDDCNPATPDGVGEPWYGAACDGPDTDMCLEGAYVCVAGARSCTDATGNNDERCNGLDDNCDGFIAPVEADADGDGYRLCEGDCNDGLPSVHPGAAEGPPGDPTCGDGLDNDCDGKLDGGDEGCMSTVCYGLTLGHTGSGNDPAASPASSPGCPAGQFLAGGAVQLTATPAAGWRVKSWTGTDNDAGALKTNKVTMPASDHAAAVNYSQGCASVVAVDADGTSTEVSGFALLIPVLGTALGLRSRARGRRNRG